MDGYVPLFYKFSGQGKPFDALVKKLVSSDRHLSELRRRIISEQYFIADPTVRPDRLRRGTATNA
jgi:hypothetical protein